MFPIHIAIFFVYTFLPHSSQVADGYRFCPTSLPADHRVFAAAYTGSTLIRPGSVQRNQQVDAESDQDDIEK